MISGTAAAAAADARAGWVRRELLEPLAARLGRAGFTVSFDPAFVGWLDGHLPTDGTSPEAFLDQSVTSKIVAGLPAGPGTLTVGLVDGEPAAIPEAG